MKRFKLSPEAAGDIREIWIYIAKNSIEASRRVRLKILEACQKIADTPGLGHNREDPTDKPALFWAVSVYVIIYNPARKPIEIVRVIHGARNVPSLL